MRGDFHDDGLTAAGHVAHVDPGRVRLPRPQLLQRPAGGGVGGVLHQLGELGVLAGESFSQCCQPSHPTHLVELQHEDLAESVGEVEVEALHHH